MKRGFKRFWAKLLSTRKKRLKVTKICIYERVEEMIQKGDSEDGEVTKTFTI
mgnify:CR=1 FL=1